MFVYESFSLIWSTISFMCLSGTLYVEVLNRGGSIYDIDSVLLNRFPLHQFLCCDNNCHDPISHGYTVQSFLSDQDEFLSYPCHATIEVLTKLSFDNQQNGQLWEGMISGKRGFIHPSAVKEMVFHCIPQHTQYCCPGISTNGSFISATNAFTACPTTTTRTPLLSSSSKYITNSTTIANNSTNMTNADPIIDPTIIDFNTLIFLCFANHTTFTPVGINSSFPEILSDSYGDLFREYYAEKESFDNFMNLFFPSGQVKERQYLASPSTGDLTLINAENFSDSSLLWFPLNIIDKIISLTQIISLEILGISILLLLIFHCLTQYLFKIGDEYAEREAAAFALLEMERSQYDEELSHSQKKMKKYEREKRLLEQRLRVISVQNDILMKEKKLLTNEAMRAASYEKTTSDEIMRLKRKINVFQTQLMVSYFLFKSVKDDVYRIIHGTDEIKKVKTLEKIHNQLAKMKFLDSYEALKNAGEVTKSKDFVIRNIEKDSSYTDSSIEDDNTETSSSDSLLENASAPIIHSKHKVNVKTSAQSSLVANNNKIISENKNIKTSDAKSAKVMDDFRRRFDPPQSGLFSGVPDAGLASSSVSPTSTPKMGSYRAPQKVVPRPLVAQAALKRGQTHSPLNVTGFRSSINPNNSQMKKYPLNRVLTESGVGNKGSFLPGRQVLSDSSESVGEPYIEEPPYSTSSRHGGRKNIMGPAKTGKEGCGSTAKDKDLKYFLVRSSADEDPNGSSLV